MASAWLALGCNSLLSTAPLSMKRIPLTQRQFATVDDEDFEMLNQYKWYFDTTGYARGTVSGRKLRMHQLLNPTSQGFMTDHINRNKLDNRRSNLRTVTKAGNQRNHKVFATNRSGVNGVSWSRAMRKWEAYIWSQNKKTILGYFDDIEKAAVARREAERTLWAR